MSGSNEKSYQNVSTCNKRVYMKEEQPERKEKEEYNRKNDIFEVRKVSRDDISRQ